MSILDFKSLNKYRIANSITVFEIRNTIYSKKPLPFLYFVISSNPIGKLQIIIRLFYPLSSRRVSFINLSYL